MFTTSVSRNIESRNTPKWLARRLAMKKYHSSAKALCIHVLCIMRSYMLLRTINTHRPLSDGILFTIQSLLRHHRLLSAGEQQRGIATIHDASSIRRQGNDVEVDSRRSNQRCHLGKSAEQRRHE